jgi:hypothetical protein
LEDNTGMLEMTYSNDTGHDNRDNALSKTIPSQGTYSSQFLRVQERPTFIMRSGRRTPIAETPI